MYLAICSKQLNIYAGIIIYGIHHQVSLIDIL
jgi:hypothetical protein